MDEWDEIARHLEQNRNEVKWQESVNRTAVALRMAFRAGRGTGDEYAPPVGLVSTGQAPRYDDVFVDGTEWLDKMARGGE